VPAVDPLGSVQFDMPSQITGRTYRISVYKPSAPAPATGWPVITLLDSRSTFATAASQVNLRIALGRPGAVVVGVGYPRNEETSRLRQIDMTPSQMPLGSAVSPGVSPADAGQAALFERFLIEELRPAVAVMAPVDPRDQTLFGYSLGGLFALGVLFEHPNLYRTIVAGSPSIWWNNREVLGKEAKFASAIETGIAAPRVLITSDRWEQYLPESMLPADPDRRAAAVAGMKRNAMVDNAQALAARLATLRGTGNYTARYTIFEDEDHATGIPAAVSRGVAFALER
jgi:predicted alpha/beta superfamily hydrolase